MIRSTLPAKAATLAPNQLKGQTQELANRQAVTDITSVDSGKTAITPLNAGEVIGFIPVPKTITLTITNTNVAGGAIDISALNNDSFTALPAGVTAVDSVGFSGKLLARLMQSINNGQGLMIYGFNISGFDSAGVASDTVLNNAALELRYFTGRGTSFVPAALDISGAERNTQTKDGLMTVKVMFMLNWLTQLKCNLGQQERIQLVLNTQPMVD